MSNTESINDRLGPRGLEGVVISDNAAITAGTINGTTIGATTAASVKGTTLGTTGYTVATLPAGVVGQRAYVTDALTPTFLGTAVGGGAVVCPVFRNATTWVTA